MSTIRMADVMVQRDGTVRERKGQKRRLGVVWSDDGSSSAVRFFTRPSTTPHLRQTDAIRALVDRFNERQEADVLPEPSP